MKNNLAQTEHRQTITDGEGHSQTKRLWNRVALLGVILIVVVFAVLSFLQRNGYSTETAGDDPLNFAEVVITDLIQEKSFNGVLGSIEDDPVKTMLGGTITSIPESGETISQGETLFAIDNEPVILLYGDLPAFRNITLGEDMVTVSGPPNGVITWVVEPGTVIQQGDVIYRVDDRPVITLYGDQPAYRALYDSSHFPSEASLTAAQASVTYASQALAQAETAYAPFRSWPDGSHSKTYYGAAWAAAQQNYDTAIDHLDALMDTASVSMTGYDVRQLEQALAALGYDNDGTLEVDSTFTPETTQAILAFQAAVGQEMDGEIDFGEIVFLPGPAQVIESLALPGHPTGSGVVNIATGDSASGIDILQLETALVALGFDAGGALEADGVYTLETNQAILDFQAAMGLEMDGIIDLGEVIFLPDEVRITTQLAALGSTIGQGTSILGISLSEKVVSMALPAGDQGALQVGDAVSVEMPDNTLVPAAVVYVSQTATSSQYDQAWFEVRIELDDPTVAGGLDEAPVDVIIISDSATGVIAIPVSALVALLEGGYAVEVDTGDGQVQLIAVEVGFFGSNNMIEITAGALQPGDRVVVP